VVSPVGAVWRYIRQNYPEIELYSSDESHPSTAGSYATACSFYTAIFRKDPLQVTYDYTLDPTDAANIRFAAKAVVYDSLLNWHIGEYDLVSDFIYSQIIDYTYQFTNLSQNANGQVWDFGLSTDTTKNPVFTFPGPGNYFVQLSAYNACDTLISCDSIFVGPTSIEEIMALQKFNIFPNPANDKLTLDLDSFKDVFVEIYDVKGIMLINIGHLQSKEIDIRILEPGVYFLKIQHGEDVITKPFLVE
jgi:hypothetical protein